MEGELELDCKSSWFKWQRVDLGVLGKKEAKNKIYLLSPSWFNHPGRSRKIARGDQGGGNQIKTLARY